MTCLLICLSPGDESWTLHAYLTHIRDGSSSVAVASHRSRPRYGSLGQVSTEEPERYPYLQVLREPHPSLYPPSRKWKFPPPGVSSLRGVDGSCDIFSGRAFIPIDRTLHYLHRSGVCEKGGQGGKKLKLGLSSRVFLFCLRRLYSMAG